MNRLLITLIFLFVNVLWVFSDAYVEVKNGGFERDRIALDTGTLQHVQGRLHQFLMLTMVVTLLSQPLMVHSLEDLLVDAMIKPNKKKKKILHL